MADDDLIALAAKDAEIERWRRLYGELEHDVEQQLGRLLGFPPYPEDWGTADVCVGDHVPESLLAAVCAEVERLRAELAAVHRMVWGYADRCAVSGGLVAGEAVAWELRQIAGTSPAREAAEPRPAVHHDPEAT